MTTLTELPTYSLRDDNGKEWDTITEEELRDLCHYVKGIAPRWEGERTPDDLMHDLFSERCGAIRLFDGEVEITDGIANITDVLQAFRGSGQTMVHLSER